MRHRLLITAGVLLALIFSVNIYMDESMKAFQYPVTPEMEEWEAFQSLDEMIEACQIPDDILSKMSTDELVEAVANYPLAINVCAYDTPQEGIAHIKEYFNGLHELSKRSTAVQSMDAYLDRYEQAGSTDFVKETFTKAVYQMLVSEKEKQ